MVVASASATANASGRSRPSDYCQATQSAPLHLNFIDENGGGPGVRLKKRPQKKRT
jgi:hypothetical protein